MESHVKPANPTNSIPQPAEPEAGRKIGRYQIERQLGAGGMGIIYLAQDIKLGRPVALKLLPQNLTHDSARVRRFQQEARAASALNHPNIITIYEVGQTAPEEGGAYFIATEFVDGLTLREKCQQGGLALSAALDTLIQVVTALAAAHEAGIIHRDIKPENIMLRHDGLVKVLDFGLAKLTETALRPSNNEFAQVTTQPGVVMGTISYMSPEQARGLDVDARSDLFSLGIVMYELLTGCAPFTGETTGDVMVALLSGDPRPLERYAPRLPGELQQIVTRALAKSADQRYQSAQELGDALKRLKADLEFAAKVKGQSANTDSILTMIVGAAVNAEEQTTFATLMAPRPDTAQINAHPTKRHWPGRRFALAGLTLLALLSIVTVWGWKWLTPQKDTIESIAVLPFANVGDDARMEYLPDGITESLIDNLYLLPALRVMARSTVFVYKGRNPDPRQIGATLKVKAIVTGRVQRQGDLLVIRVELVDTKDGARLWSELYQRPAADLLQVQKEITHEITEALRQRLSSKEERLIAKRYTRNTEAYSLYLQGRYYWNKRSGDGMRKSIEFFQQAIELDSSFALAYVGLADARATLGSYHLEPPRIVLPLAREAAERALALDDQLAEAHASLGKIFYDYYWDWPRAEGELKRALELNPNYATARHWYAALLASLGRFDESIAEAHRAVERDFSPAVSTELGNVLYRARRYDEAIAVLRKTLDADPTYVSARAYLALCYSMQGRHQEALAEAKASLAAVPNNPDIIALVGCVYGLAGQRDQARKCLKQLNEMSGRVYVSPSPMSGIYASMGEVDAAMDWLEKCYEERIATMRAMKTDPLCDPLRSSPRFQDLMRRVGFTP